MESITVHFKVRCPVINYQFHYLQTYFYEVQKTGTDHYVVNSDYDLHTMFQIFYQQGS